MKLCGLLQILSFIRRQDSVSTPQNVEKKTSQSAQTQTMVTSCCRGNAFEVDVYTPFAISGHACDSRELHELDILYQACCGAMESQRCLKLEGHHTRSLTSCTKYSAAHV